LRHRGTHGGLLLYLRSYAFLFGGEAGQITGEREDRQRDIRTRTEESGDSATAKRKGKI